MQTPIKQTTKPAQVPLGGGGRQMEPELGTIQAVILAGGEGTHLRPLTKNRSKVLLPAANRPILLHLLDSVVAAGVRDITVVVGYKSEQVMRVLSSYPIEITTVMQHRQTGVMDAIKTATPNLHADRILLLAGDNYVDAAAIRALTEEKNAILVAPSAMPAEYGVIRQENGILTDIAYQQTAEPAGTLVSCAASILERSVHDIFLTCEGLENVRDLFSYGIKVIETDSWEDALTIPCLLRQNASILEKQTPHLGGIIDKTAVIRGLVSIGKNTIIEPDVVIIGPAVIGENSHIKAHVYIGPGTSIGSQVTVEPFTYLANVILMDGCYIGAQSRITDSVIGEGAVITQAVTIPKEEFGAAVGDRACIGAFTQLKGAHIGNNAVIDGGKTISERIPDEARVM